MGAATLLADLIARGITLMPEGAALRVRGPQSSCCAPDNSSPAPVLARVLLHRFDAALAATLVRKP